MNVATIDRPERQGFGSLICSLIKIAALVVLCASAHGQTVLHVDDDAGPGGDGASWVTAFDSLQAGLDAAAVVASAENPVELRVAQGRYVPTNRTDEADPRSATFQLLNNVSIMGGFAGIGAANPDLRDLDVYETILSGDISGDDELDFVNYDDNTYHVTTGSGTDGSAAIDGLSVVGGNGDVDDPEFVKGRGGGVFIVDGALIVRNCRFYGNFAIKGGGIYARGNNSLQILGSTFTANRASGGAAVFQFGVKSIAYTVVDGCIFSENLDDGRVMGINGTMQTIVRNSVFNDNLCGGPALAECALVVEFCHFEGNTDPVGAGLAIGTNVSGVVRECKFTRNVAGAVGGGAKISSAIDVVNCDFERNEAGWFAGGAFSGSSPRFINCALWGNKSEIGGGMYNAGFTEFINCSLSGNDGSGITSLASNTSPGLLAVSNCVLWGNYPAELDHDITWPAPPAPLVNNSCVHGGWSGPGSNNIDLDPMFIQPGCGNLRLAHDSPCIDAGDNSAIPSGVTTDLDGNPRILNGLVDMGAYEGGHDMLPPTACENDLDAGEFVRLIPSGGPFNPQVSAAVNVTNVTEETNDAWATVESTEVHAHPNAAGYRDLAEILTMQTSLANGQMFTRVMIPFDADDIGVLNPLDVDVTFFDASADRWRLAVEANTVNSPKHEGPVGDRIVVEGTAGPYGFTAQVGDHGVFWNAKKQRGFAWANVDHATEFGIGTLLSSCQADCAEPSGVVGPADLLVVMSGWGDAVAGEPADVNADRMVNIDDILYVVSHWGPCS